MSFLTYYVNLLLYLNTSSANTVFSLWGKCAKFIHSIVWTLIICAIPQIEVLLGLRFLSILISVTSVVCIYYHAFTCFCWAAWTFAAEWFRNHKVPTTYFNCKRRGFYLSRLLSLLLDGRTRKPLVPVENLPSIFSNTITWSVLSILFIIFNIQTCAFW